MRDDDEARLTTNSEQVLPLGPSVYTGPTGHTPEAVPAVDVSTAPAGPCVYTPAPGNRSYTTATKAAPISPRPRRA